MYITDKLVFLELHKTGGTHIGRWLEQIVGGERKGKHNRLAPSLADRHIVGSIRNPWDWYVSLWAYGCQQQGSVYQQTTDSVNPRYYRRQLHREMGLPRTTIGKALIQSAHDLKKDRRAWQAVYADSNDPSLFQEWLSMILAPEHRFALREGFGFSPVSQHSGLMTYRYLKLFTSLGDRLYSDAALSSQASVESNLQEWFIVDSMIRNENLENDLIAAIESAGYKLNATDAEALISARDQKTNTSKRKAARYYYDERSSGLVEEKEALIIRRHGYTAPDQEHSI